MFTISRKLYAGFFIVLLLMASILTISYTELSSINTSYENMLDDRVHKALIAKDIIIAIRDRQVAGRGYLLSGDEAELDNYEAAQHKFEKISNELGLILNTKKGKEIFQEINRLSDHYDRTMQRAFTFKKQNQYEEYTEVIRVETPPIVKDLKGKSDEFIKLQEDKLKQQRAETVDKAAAIKLLMGVIGVIAILLGIGVAVVISRMISKPVIAMAASAEKIAGGDLSGDLIRVKNKDEIGQLAVSFNQMTGSLRDLIRQVSITSEQVAASAEELTASAEETSKATGQITNSIQEMAVGSEKQVSSVEESSNAIQELSIGVRQIAANAQEVANYMADTSEVASNGENTVTQAIQQMGEISNTVTHLNEVIKVLGSRSQEIEKIVEVITGIASQTNLLALNAAIEAARAGESGRGFAVVADEVRKLAEQSAESARQISQLIVMIQNETDKAVETMMITTDKVQKGMMVVDSTGDSFKQIVLSVEKVAGQIEEVSSASQQMSAGTEQIVGSIHLISEITEQSAAGSQLISASSEEQLASMEEISESALSLSKMAEELQIQVGKFKL